MKTLSSPLKTLACTLAGTAATLTFGMSAQATSIMGAFDASGNAQFSFAPPVDLGAATSISIPHGTFDITSALPNFMGQANQFHPLVGTQGNILFIDDLLGPIAANTPIFDFGPLVDDDGNPATPDVPRYHFRATGAFTKAPGGLATSVTLTKIGELVDLSGALTTSVGLITLTANTSDPTTGIGSYSFSLSVPPSTPEPGTVLAILAVAGIGALARCRS